MEGSWENHIPGTTNTRWILDTVWQLCLSLWFVCSPLSPPPTMSCPQLYFRSPSPSTDDLPSCCKGETEAIGPVPLHLTIIRYITTHTWAHCLHLLSNSMSKKFLLPSKANPSPWGPHPLPYVFAKTVILKSSLLSLHHLFLPR